MSELWIPRPEKKHGLFTFFDIMLALQENLDTIHDESRRFATAAFSTLSLAKQLKEMKHGGLSVELVTDIAIVDTAEEVRNGTIVKRIGILGVIDDVHCISVGESVPLSYSLSLDVARTFKAEDPDTDFYHLNKAIAPIGSVHYIESLAS